ncbi:MAG: hypothetical protein IT225_07505 [Flavobacteriales bacterium]|nr:hypothetical protein [Flavobacteriales bacterium]
MIREGGRPMVIDWISEEIDMVNRLCGGGMDQATVTMCAELILDRFKFRTANALRIALRDGLNSGKIFGKLTYPLIGEWLTAHEEAVEAMNYQQHLATK